MSAVSAVQVDFPRLTARKTSAPTTIPIVVRNSKQWQPRVLDEAPRRPRGIGLRGAIAVPWKVDVRVSISVDEGETASCAEIVAAIEELHVPREPRDEGVVWGRVTRLAASVVKASRSMAAADICMVMESLVKLSRLDPAAWQQLQRADPGLLHALAARACSVEVMGQLSARQTARLLWVVGRLRAHQPVLVAALGRRLLDLGVLSELSGRDLSMAVWGMARTGQANPKVLAALAEHITDTGMADALSPQSVANTVWGHSRLSLPHEGLLRSLAGRIVQGRFLATAKPAEVASAAWAFASLGWRDAALMRRLAACVVERGLLPALREQELVALLWAFARLKVVDGPLLEAATSHLLQSPRIESLSPRALALTVWSLATLQPQSTVVVARLAAQAKRSVAGFGAREVAPLVWGLAMLQFRDPILMHALGQHIAQPGYLQAAGARTVANVVWAFARLSCLTSPLLTAVSRACGNAELLATFREGDLSQLLWALAAVRCSDERLVRLLLGRVAALLPDFQPALLTSVVSSMARLGARDAALLARLAARIAQPAVLAGFRPKELVVLAEAFARLPYRNATALGPIGDRLALAPLLPRQVVAVAWAFARLRVWHPRLVPALAQRFRDPAFTATLEPRQAASIAFSFAWLRQPCNPLYSMLAKAITDPDAPALNIRDSAITAWAFVAARAMADEALAVLLWRLTADPGAAARHCGVLQPVLADVRLQPGQYPRSGRVLERAARLARACREAYVPPWPRADRYHVGVAGGLRRLGLPFTENTRLPGAAGYWADFHLSPDAAALLSAPRSPQLVAPGVETPGFEEPSQALPVAVEVLRPNAAYILVRGQNRLAGPTLMKFAHLTAFGYRVVALPYYELECLATPEDMAIYLSQKLRQQL